MELIEITYQGLKKNCYAKTDWLDITLRNAIDISKIEMPERFLKILAAKTIEERIEISKGCDEDDDVYRYSCEVISKLTDFDKSFFDNANRNVMLKFFFENYFNVCMDIHQKTCTTYEPNGIRTYKDYTLPRSANIGGREVFLFGENVEYACDVIDLFVSGWDMVPYMMAKLLKSKDDINDDRYYTRKSDEMMDIPMAVVWEVFFSFLTFVNNSTIVTNGCFPVMKVKATSRLMRIAEAAWQIFTFRPVSTRSLQAEYVETLTKLN